MAPDPTATSRPERALRIRPATSADADFIRALGPRFARASSLPWRDPVQIADFVNGSADYAVTQTQQPELGHRVLIATAGDGQSLGFIHLYNEYSRLTNEAQGYVAMVAVTEAAEGRGVGRALLAAGEAWAREQGFRHLALDTFGDNAHARAVYAHLGFAEESVKLVKAL